MKYYLAALAVFFLLAAQLVLASDYLAEGKRLEDSNEFNKAVGAYLEGINRQPSVELYLAAGKLLGKLKQYQRGAALMSEALSKYPGNQPLGKLGALFKTRTADGHNSTTAGAQPVLPVTEPDATGSLVVDLAVLPVDQQASAAIEIILGLQKVDPQETAHFEAALKKLIATCPASEYAPQACWKLANLYLFAENQPDYDKALPLLEKIVNDYPASSLAGPCLTRLRSIAETSGNYSLLLKTARLAQNLKIWNAEELNFWVCHEGAALVHSGDRAGGLEKIRQISLTAESTPRAAEYASLLIENF